MKLVLAKGVEFDADKHEYWHRGQRLSGVTGLISKKLGLKMPQEFVEEHRLEGIHVHRAVQKWIETGDPESVHSGVTWLIDTLPNRNILFSEVLVSDFKQYASAVDIIQTYPPRKGFEVGEGFEVSIYDIKKGVFKREYVTWQLSIYKYFIEKYVKKQVGECVCICMKDREYYKIFPKPFEQVEKLLYG
jgi:hypothetical protein